jgi:hypothetical protein
LRAAETSSREDPCSKIGTPEFHQLPPQDKELGFEKCVSGFGAELQRLTQAGAPLGTIISSSLGFSELTSVDPDFGKYWQPADGRAAPKESRYDEALKLRNKESPVLPDLRGVFLRGLDKFAGDTGLVEGDRSDPDNTRSAGSFQRDAIQDHSHRIVKDMAGQHEVPGIPGQHDSDRGIDTPSSRSTSASYQNDPVFVISSPITPQIPRKGRDVEVASETRPKNVALFFYVRVN